MLAAVSRLDGDWWCDIRGARLALFCWVEQVEEAPEPGALPSRLGQRGEVVGRGLESLFVRFPDRAVLSVAPWMLRLLPDMTAGELLMSTPAVIGDPPVSHSDDAVVLLAWITLSRVADGNVTKQGENYLDGDAPLPPYLTMPITMLLTEELLAVADADPAGWCQVILTEAGQTHHEQLRHRGARGMDQ